MNGKICAFFGHRSVIEKGDLESEVYSVVKELINSGFSTFMFGGFGEFDELCHKVVSRLKTENQHIKRVYCLTDEKFLRETKRPKYLKSEDYEEFVYLTLEFDYWYTRIYYRNCEIIKLSDFIIFYAREDENSGAYKALKFAKKAKKNFINLIDK